MNHSYRQCRFPDAYHSCYTLAGLSSAQHSNYYTGVSPTDATYPLDSAMRWDSCPRTASTEQPEHEDMFDPGDRLLPVHPIYVIPWAAVERTYTKFVSKIGF